MENKFVFAETIREQKQALRLKMASALMSVDWATVSPPVIDKLKAYLGSFSGGCLAGYWPYPSEVNITPLLKEWSQKDNVVCLPVVTNKEAPLDFYPWTPDMLMEEGVYKIPIPKDRTTPVIPDILLVPLLAFDDKGHRLGRGAGYYDRTIEKLRRLYKPHVIGIACEQQFLPFVPTGGHDQALDVVITDSFIRKLP